MLPVYVTRLRNISATKTNDVTDGRVNFKGGENRHRRGKTFVTLSGSLG